MEWASEEELKGSVFDDVSVDLEDDVADLHGQIFCTSEGCAECVDAFHV